MAEQDIPENVMPYKERMTLFVADEEYRSLDDKYDAYFEIQGIDGITALFDILQNPPGEKLTGKLFWKARYDPPLELKKDIIRVYNRHFVD